MTRMRTNVKAGLAGAAAAVLAAGPTVALVAASASAERSALTSALADPDRSTR